MKQKQVGFISEQEASYIQLLLEHQDEDSKETGLERLCTLYRNGYRLTKPHAVQQLFNALLYNDSPKVRRWTLNAIALIGNRKTNLQATLEAINRNRGDNDVLGAGVAALVRLMGSENLLDQLRKLDIPAEGAPLLAAAQQTDEFHGTLGRTKLDPDQSDDSELRLASILVGLDKAPENLFSSRHSNSAVIGSLNRHDDGLVAQYSVWAIYESSGMGLSSLGIPLKDIEDLPENVRAWIYRLITSNEVDAEGNRELILLGSQDPSGVTRVGLAKGLEGAYFDGLEEITVEWLENEVSTDTRSAILDHMARYGERCIIYKERVISAYKSEDLTKLDRVRLETASQGTPLYGELKRISFQSSTFDLFSDQGAQYGGVMMTTEIKAKNVSIGAISGKDTNISGNLEATQNAQESALRELGDLRKLLESESGEDIEDGKELIRSAEGRPSKESISRVISWMKQIKDGANYAASTTKSFTRILSSLSSIMDKLEL